MRKLAVGGAQEALLLADPARSGPNTTPGLDGWAEAVRSGGIRGYSLAADVIAMPGGIAGIIMEVRGTEAGVFADGESLLAWWARPQRLERERMRKLLRGQERRNLGLA